jgi:hypothetical protein
VSKLASQADKPILRIGTTGEGTMAVNDPLLRDMWNTILDNKSINWDSFWKKSVNTIKDRRARSYESPHQSVSLAILLELERFNSQR